MPRRDAYLREVEAPEPPKVDRAIWSDGAVTVSQAAALLATSRKSVFGMMSSGQLAWGRLGSRRRIPRRAVLNLLMGGVE